VSGAPALPTPRRVRVIVNADGGTVRAGGVLAIELAEASAHHGIEAEMRFVPGRRGRRSAGGTGRRDHPVRRRRGRRLRLRAEGWSTPHRTPCLFIDSNACGMQLMTLDQRDRLDSGRLWQFLAKQRTRVGLLWFALRATVGSIEQVRDFEGPSSPTLEIDMHASRVHVATDGEATTMRRPPRHYRSRPQALRVFATPAPVA
jgi:hypothetical protein